MIRAAHVRRLPARTTGERVSAGPRPQAGRSESRGPVHHDFSAVRVLAPQVQRWSYGSGAPPHADYRVVPADHHKDIDAAMGLLDRVATQPKAFPVCHKFFENQCSGGTASSFADQVNAAVIWLDTDKTVWASSVAPSNLAYRDTTQRMGRWSVAGVFAHEMMHMCGQHNEKTNDTAIVKCGFPDIQAFFDKQK